MLSVICPVLNEATNIRGLLKFFIESFPQDKELLIIDGGSSDDTEQIVSEIQQNHVNIKLFYNSNKTVPYALNIGIKNSFGDPIIRIDAHTKYSTDYFEKIVEIFNKTGADIVGGPTRIADGSDFQKAVGIVILHPFGIGNSKVHDVNFEGFTDHVTFGAWRRCIFEDVGLFDEKLTRNQDDEFHYRAKSLGKKIFQSPEIKLWYFPRNSLTTLFHQYFQYGYFKPLVLFKVPSEIKFRHFIPSLFFIYVMTLYLGLYNIYYLIPLIIYLIILLSISIIYSKSMKVMLFVPFVISTIHIAYGSGFIIRLINFLFRKNNG